MSDAQMGPLVPGVRQVDGLKGSCQAFIEQNGKELWEGPVRRKRTEALEDVMIELKRRVRVKGLPDE